MGGWTAKLNWLLIPFSSLPTHAQSSHSRPTGSLAGKLGEGADRGKGGRLHTMRNIAQPLLLHSSRQERIQCSPPLPSHPPRHRWGNTGSKQTLCSLVAVGGTRKPPTA